MKDEDIDGKSMTPWNWLRSLATFLAVLMWQLVSSAMSAFMFVGFLAIASGVIATGITVALVNEVWIPEHPTFFSNLEHWMRCVRPLAYFPAARLLVQLLKDAWNASICIYNLIGEFQRILIRSITVTISECGELEELAIGLVDLAASILNGHIEWILSPNIFTDDILFPNSTLAYVKIFDSVHRTFTCGCSILTPFTDVLLYPLIDEDLEGIVTNVYNFITFNRLNSAYVIMIRNFINLDFYAPRLNFRRISDGNGCQMAYQIQKLSERWYTYTAIRLFGNPLAILRDPYFASLRILSRLFCSTAQLIELTLEVLFNIDNPFVYMRTKFDVGYIANPLRKPYTVPSQCLIPNTTIYNNSIYSALCPPDDGIGVADAGAEMFTFPIFGDSLGFACITNQSVRILTELLIVNTYGFIANLDRLLDWLFYAGPLCTDPPITYPAAQDANCSNFNPTIIAFNDLILCPCNVFGLLQTVPGAGQFAPCLCALTAGGFTVFAELARSIILFGQSIARTANRGHAVNLTGVIESIKQPLIGIGCSIDAVLSNNTIPGGRCTTEWTVLANATGDALLFWLVIIQDVVNGVFTLTTNITAFGNAQYLIQIIDNVITPIVGNATYTQLFPSNGECPRYAITNKRDGVFQAFGRALACAVRINAAGEPFIIFGNILRDAKMQVLQIIAYTFDLIVSVITLQIFKAFQIFFKMLLTYVCSIELLFKSFINGFFDLVNLGGIGDLLWNFLGKGFDFIAKTLGCLIEFFDGSPNLGCIMAAIKKLACLGIFCKREDLASDFPVLMALEDSADRVQYFDTVPQDEMYRFLERLNASMSVLPVSFCTRHIQFYVYAAGDDGFRMHPFRDFWSTSDGILFFNCLIEISNAPSTQGIIEQKRRENLKPEDGMTLAEVIEYYKPGDAMAKLVEYITVDAVPEFKQWWATPSNPHVDSFFPRSPLEPKKGIDWEAAFIPTTHEAHMNQLGLLHFASTLQEFRYSFRAAWHHEDPNSDPYVLETRETRDRIERSVDVNDAFIFATGVFQCKWLDGLVNESINLFTSCFQTNSTVTYRDSYRDSYPAAFQYPLSKRQSAEDGLITNGSVRTSSRFGTSTLLNLPSTYEAAQILKDSGRISNVSDIFEDIKAFIFNNNTDPNNGDPLGLKFYVGSFVSCRFANLKCPANVGLGLADAIKWFIVVSIGLLTIGWLFLGINMIIIGLMWTFWFPIILVMAYATSIRCIIPVPFIDTGLPMFPECLANDISDILNSIFIDYIPIVPALAYFSGYAELSCDVYIPYANCVYDRGFDAGGIGVWAYFVTRFFPSIAATLRTQGIFRILSPTLYGFLQRFYAPGGLNPTDQSCSYVLVASTAIAVSDFILLSLPAIVATAASIVLLFWFIKAFTEIPILDPILNDDANHSASSSYPSSSKERYMIVRPSAYPRRIAQSIIRSVGGVDSSSSYSPSSFSFSSTMKKRK